MHNQQMLIIFVESNKEIFNMLNEKEKQELKTLIEEEEFKQDESEREWKVAVNDCLDILSPLYQRLNEQ